mgnify:CR=1 FL=1
MGASQYDFTIEQGSSFKMSLIYKDSNGNPIDISGWCARLTWRTSSNTTQTFDSANTNKASYDFNLEGALGKINLLFPASTTNEFDFNNAKYDLELQSDELHYTQGGKYVTRLLFGTISIQKRFSKSSTALECP